MRVYLDNCCDNRPFDDQSQVKAFLETVAKLSIQQKMRGEPHRLSGLSFAGTATGRSSSTP